MAEHPTVFNLVSQVPPKYGGLTRSVFERASMFVGAGVDVTLLVRNYIADTHEILASSVERGILDPRVKVRCFWEVGAPSGDGGAETAVERVAGGVSEIVEVAGCSVERIRVSGRLRQEVEHDPEGRVHLVRHFDTAGRLEQEDDFDTRGRLVTRTTYDAERGVPVQADYLDRDGSVWLTHFIDPEAKAHRVRVRDPQAPTGFRQLSSRGAAQAAWISATLAPVAHPVLLADSRSGDTVALGVKGEHVRLIAIGHNNHRRPNSVTREFKTTWAVLVGRAHEYDAIVLLTEQQKADIRGVLDQRANLTVISHPAHPPGPSEAPIERSDRRLVCLARLSKQKRLDHAIQAFALVLREIPDAKLDIYGSGPEDEALQRLIDQLGVGSSVVLRGHTADPEGVLRGAAALFMSSDYEGLPLVLSEALSVGTPVISYDLKYGPRTVIRDGVDGLLAQDADVPALAAAVVRFLRDPQLRARMSQAGPEVLERFPRSRWQQQWLDLIDRVAAEPVRRQDELRNPQSYNRPGVSVIMPVLNEEPHLRQAVRAVLNQGYSGPLEVVLALGPSADGTEAVARRLARDPRVVVVDNPSGRTPTGLNLALKASSQPIVVRVDGHAIIPPGYLTHAVSTLEETGAANVGGVMAAQGETAFERAVACAMTSRFGVGSAAFHVGGQPGPADTVYLGAFRREALERAGGYDERFLRAQDWELNHRLREAGEVVWFDPALTVSYRPRPNLRALAKQYRDYGRWRRVVARRHQGTVGWRYLAPPLTMIAVVLGVAAGLVGLVAGPLWLALGLVAPLAYLSAVLGAALRAPGGYGRRSRLWLLAVYPTMHASWAWGFLTSPRRLGS